jgi:hypothetical protein
LPRVEARLLPLPVLSVVLMVKIVCRERESEAIMRRINVGANFTVFLLFFGVAMLEAFQTGNWIKAAFWLAIAVVFLAADNRNKSDQKI